MPTTRNAAVVALVFSTTLATGAMAASPAPCPPGLQKTEGEGGAVHTAAHGVQKTEGEGTDWYATHGLQKSEGATVNTEQGSVQKGSGAFPAMSGQCSRVSTLASFLRHDAELT